MVHCEGSREGRSMQEEYEMRIEGDNVILSTGTTFYANKGILGISGQRGMDITQGYDGGICEDFTQKEKAEIAEYVIALWKQWAPIQLASDETDRPQPKKILRGRRR